MKRIPETFHSQNYMSFCRDIKVYQEENTAVLLLLLF